jgi:hypothetical protein
VVVSVMVAGPGPSTPGSDCAGGVGGGAGTSDGGEGGGEGSTGAGEDASDVRANLNVAAKRLLPTAVASCMTPCTPWPWSK